MLDLKIASCVINLEWIQSCTATPGSRLHPGRVTDTILRRMPDYVN